jgi:hypothetical protein
MTSLDNNIGAAYLPPPTSLPPHLPPSSLLPLGCFYLSPLCREARGTAGLDLWQRRAAPARRLTISPMAARLSSRGLQRRQICGDSAWRQELPGRRAEPGAPLHERRRVEAPLPASGGRSSPSPDGARRQEECVMQCVLQRWPGAVEADIMTKRLRWLTCDVPR